MLRKKKTKQVVYQVQCSYDPSHVFERVFEIEQDSENIETKVQAYCYKCDKHVNVTVKGRVVADQEILRKFDLD